MLWCKTNQSWYLTGNFNRYKVNVGKQLQQLCYKLNTRLSNFEISVTIQVHSHGTLYPQKVGTNFADNRRSLGRYSSPADSDHRVSLFVLLRFTGLCSLSGILKHREQNVSETGSVSVLRWGGGDIPLLSPLDNPCGGGLEEYIHLSHSSRKRWREYNPVPAGYKYGNLAPMLKKNLHGLSPRANYADRRLSAK
jgi:hypothetical protein